MVREIGRDRYEVVEGFFKRPKGWTFVEVADVSVDADDNVYVFNRGNHPVMIFDRDGNFLDAWGEIDGAALLRLSTWDHRRYRWPRVHRRQP